MEKAKSLAAVSIPEKTVCEHKFHAFLDKNFEVRGYQRIDFELPSDIKENRIKKDIFHEDDLLNIETIKWNLPPDNMIYLLHGIIFERNFLFILPNSKTEMIASIKNFIDLIFQNTFKYNLSILSEKDYKKIKKDFKNHDLIGWNEIIRDKDKIYEKKNLEVEAKIVKNFYDNLLKQDAVIELEYEIRKIHSICKNLLELNKEFDPDKPINALSLIQLLNERFSIKIEIQYLEYILEVLKYYFKTVIPVEKTPRIQKFLSLF
ncbi:MAG: hypothetical protein GF383_03825 [Candidatus Lokiarchaeota archaeon]|nr:hypothetical protein [Candidatus Lokiarchaeota archaeon]MBD3338833.1 hypothetical protein [Candidatus Lokiarchaeota archaeon]